MSAVLRVLVVVVATLARFIRPGGLRSLAAENIALRQQLIVLKRGRRRAPHLRPIDRIVLALSSMLIQASRLSRVAIAVRPSTLRLRHRALIRRKYKPVFTPKSRRQPGPKGPSVALRTPSWPSKLAT